MVESRTKHIALLIRRDTLTVQHFKAELIGVMFHIGSTTISGHYTSVINVNNIWYYRNDKVITVLDFIDMCNSKERYIFVYGVHS